MSSFWDDTVTLLFVLPPLFPALRDLRSFSSFPNIMG